MKNKPSNLEKAFAFALPVIVGGFVAFLLIFTLRKNFALDGGALIAVAAAGLGLYLFIRVRKNKTRIYKPSKRSYDENRLTNLVMQKIYEAYNVKEEPADNEDEDEDYAEEDARGVNAGAPANDAYFSPIFDDGREDGVIKNWAARLNSEVLWFLGVAWIVVYLIAGNSLAKPLKDNALGGVAALPSALAFVLSGLAVAVKGEYRGQQGQMATGLTAYLMGFARIALGAVIAALWLGKKI